MPASCHGMPPCQLSLCLPRRPRRAEPRSPRGIAEDLRAQPPTPIPVLLSPAISPALQARTPLRIVAIRTGLPCTALSPSSATYCPPRGGPLAPGHGLRRPSRFRRRLGRPALSVQPRTTCVVQDRTSAPPAGPAPKRPYLFPGANPPYPRTPDQLPIAKTSAGAPIRRPYLLTEKFPPRAALKVQAPTTGLPLHTQQNEQGLPAQGRENLKQKITSLPEITSAPQGREYKPD